MSSGSSGLVVASRLFPQNHILWSSQWRSPQCPCAHREPTKTWRSTKSWSTQPTRRSAAFPWTQLWWRRQTSLWGRVSAPWTSASICPWTAGGGTAMPSLWRRAPPTTRTAWLVSSFWSSAHYWFLVYAIFFEIRLSIGSVLRHRSIICAFVFRGIRTLTWIELQMQELERR